MIRRMSDPPRSRGRAFEVFRVFLKLGITSFGGPIAHLGYFREEFVARRRWLNERQYADLVALCQFIPGPASSQVGFAIGLGRAGYLGALAAWVAFTLPSALLLIAFASGAALFSGAVGVGMLSGLQAVAVAVVAHAVWGMARSLTPDLGRAVIGICGAVLALTVSGTLGQLAAILFGAGAGLIVCRRGRTPLVEDRPMRLPVTPRAGLLCLALLTAVLVLLPILASATGSPLLRIADAFSRAGALVLGGGHVMLPLLQAEPAIVSSVSPEEFLAGYGAAQAVPGPLFAFAAYLGMVAQPDGGALFSAVALLSVFLPGMLLLIGVLPFWYRLQRIRGASAALRGAQAAVVGILAAALYRPLIVTGITGPITLLIALGCAALLALRVPAWIAVLLGAALGAVGGLLGLGTDWS